jgi:hypothetical protein
VPSPSPVVLPLVLGSAIGAVIAFAPFVVYRIFRPDLGLMIIAGAFWYLGTWYLFGHPKKRRP